MTEINLNCEIKKVSSKKTASLDVEYEIVLNTPDSQALTLGMLSGDSLVDVNIKLSNG